jgi:2-polyprenyl-3-methyl-5-hydroxy-6-metoxy-1,4-benzoquinol methylase
MKLRPQIYDGVVHAAYSGRRDDVIALVPPRGLRVLDVGCSVGAMGQALKQNGHEVTGIELNADFAARARLYLDRVIEADVETLALTETDVGGPFDCIVFADVLEHLRDPWSITRWAATLLSDSGCFVISVPNVRHAQLVRSVLRHRRWPYEDVGIFDRTHLRWFAFHNLPELLDDTGLEITQLERVYALSLNPTARVNRLASHLGDFGTLQFVFRAEHLGAP